MDGLMELKFVAIDDVRAVLARLNRGKCIS